jgi:hypothetical protein
MKSGNSSTAVGVVNHDDVSNMLERVGLAEDNFDDIVFEEEEKQPKEATRWVDVAKVHTETKFSHFSFFKNIRAAWYLAKEVKTRVIEENLFVLKFACLGYWEKSMEGGTWVFRWKSVLLAPYD